MKLSLKLSLWWFQDTREYIFFMVYLPSSPNCQRASAPSGPCSILFPVRQAHRGPVHHFCVSDTSCRGPVHHLCDAQFSTWSAGLSPEHQVYVLLVMMVPEWAVRNIAAVTAQLLVCVNVFSLLSVTKSEIVQFI